jgi:uncharacterized protein YbjQ (UPF0145 family)
MPSKDTTTAKLTSRAPPNIKVDLKDDLADVDLHDIMMTSEQRMGDITMQNTFGIVTGQTIYGVNFLKEVIGFVQNIIGGKMYLFEKDFKDARKRCLKQMAKQARKEWPRCNAIVDIRFSIFGLGGIIAVVTTGTAVRIDK